MMITTKRIGIVLCLLSLIILLYVAKDKLLAIAGINQQNETQVSQNNTLPPTDSNNSIPQITSNNSNPNLVNPNFNPSQSSNPPPSFDSAVFGRGGREHLTPVPQQYTNKYESVHQDVYSPLLSLIEAANKDGINLKIVSAYRSYDHQRSIWERKWGSTPNNDTNKALSILSYSSFPGTSRHHWGTDVDFNSVSLSYWQGSEGQKVHQWLTRNAPQFGFCQVYAPGRTQGYSDEPWHWSHIASANMYYSQIKQPAVLNVALSQPVRGSEAVRQMPNAIMGYINGISTCVTSNSYRGTSSTIANPPIESVSGISPQPTSQTPNVGYLNNQRLNNAPSKSVQAKSTQGLEPMDYPANEHIFTEPKGSAIRDSNTTKYINPKPDLPAQPLSPQAPMKQFNGKTADGGSWSISGSENSNFNSNP